MRSMPYETSLQSKGAVRSSIKKIKTPPSLRGSFVWLPPAYEYNNKYLNKMLSMRYEAAR